MSSNNPFTQKAVWPFTTIKKDGVDDIDGFESFFQDEFGVRVKFIKEIVTNATANNGEKRIDTLFFIHEEDIPKIAIKRFSLGISWLEDVLNNNPNLYPKSETFE